jgi:hypothetical protein
MASARANRQELIEKRFSLRSQGVIRDCVRVHKAIIAVMISMTTIASKEIDNGRIMIAANINSTAVVDIVSIRCGRIAAMYIAIITTARIGKEKSG